MRNRMRYAVLILFLSVFSFSLAAQEDEKPKDIFQQAEQQADRLQKELDLEDWQVFYVDSVLKRNYAGMMADYEGLKASKVANSALYVAVQDRWMEKIDAAFSRIFTKEQWTQYLKSGAARAQKARAKRKAKAQTGK